METRVEIKTETLLSSRSSLSRILADEFVLSTKTRKAHWNVEGADFYSKHKFFEDQYKELDTCIDEIAERIRAIGYNAPASLKEFLDHTHLTEQSRETNDSEGFIRELLHDHEHILSHLLEIQESTIGFLDPSSSDYVTRLIGMHEKMAWMLRSHLT